MHWKVKDYLEGQVTLTREALTGSDLWFEEFLYNKIFMSDTLAQALIEANLDKDWRLVPCAIVKGGQMNIRSGRVAA
jgi:hypothetical protein